MWRWNVPFLATGSHIPQKTVGGIKLDDYMVHHKGGELSLLTFNLQLNQLLMLINNPMLFPHIAYAEMFDRNEEESKDE